ncbi:MAG: roadblock/LC7 domain-containing protein [Thermoanaerobaculia bacterium]|nr:roadblock/LC7 domain-containing protein [Thermoanaerobaculia bacterium]
MPYQYILANLLARNEGAVGVLFVDDSGETVDLACADFSPFQMRIVAAYVGIYLRQVQEFFGEMENGAPNWLHIEKDSLHIYVAPLPDGYFLVLVQRAPALAAQARASLADACEQLTRELFTSV